MATQTTHYHLIKPSSAERVAVGDINDNSDIIDGNLFTANERADQMADDYNASETYNTGDYVRRENYLYKCNTDNTTGTWDDTKWDRVKVMDEITQGGGGGSSTLAGLNDVSLTSPTDGQLLGYNGTSHKWENVNGGGGGSSTLAGLSDVSVSGVANKDIIRYNSTTQKYEKSSDLTDLELSVSQLSSSVLSIAGDVDTLELTVSQMSASTLPYDANTTIKQKIDEKADASSLSNVATSGSYTDLSNKPKVYEYIEVPNTTDGRYYTYTLTHIAPARFPIIILRNTQDTGNLSDRIIYGQVSNSSSANVIAFSSNTVTYNQSTKTITIDNGNNAWARPYICYPSGALA